MTKQNNQSKKSGQLARLSQKQNNPSNNNNNMARKVEKAPVAFSSPTLTKRPVIQSSLRMTRIKHRELVGNVVGNTTFGVSSYSLNPGLVTSFPWLSTVASSFEQYSFKSLRYHFVTRCATSYVGSVLLAPEYDALDAAPSTEILASMMDGACEDVPWRDQYISFDPQGMYPLGPRKFIRAGSLSNVDLKTYDAGQLFVCLAGCADTSTVGKLWVEYDVELHIPQNPNAPASVGIGSLALATLHAAQTISNNTATKVAFDTLAYNTIGVTNTAGSFVLPIGNYKIESTITVNDTLAEIHVFTLEVRKNGAASSPIYQSVSNLSAAGSVANGNLCMNVLGYINSVSTDAVSIYVTFTGAGGTLTLPADSSQISITAVI